MENFVSDWISVEDRLPPIFQDKKETFLAAWFDPGDGGYDGIEWYSWGGVEGVYMNQNSGNMNRLGGEGNIKMFTYWMPLPEPAE